MTREEAIYWTWYYGELRYLLDPTQQRMYDAVKAFKKDPNAGKFFYLNCARQLGKSFLLCVLSLEDCLQIPGARVKYPAPTQKMARAIVRPQLFKILEQCPPELRPTFASQDGEWRFGHNNSVLTLFGCDGDNFERGRGQTANSVYPDEFGFMDRAEDMLMDVFVPQLQTTGGKVVVATSPADSVDHYSTQLARECEARGTYLKFTAHDNTRVPKAELDAICKEYGGPTSTRWRREYLCEFVTDSSNMVLPSWTDERAAKLVVDGPRPKAFDSYVSIDLGVQDATGILFGYYDFERARLVIEDEWREQRKNTQQIVDALIPREEQLWGTKQPYRRIYDAGAGGDRFAMDVNFLHGFNMVPALKDKGIHAMVNRVDVWLVHERIEIRPRCKRLIQEMFGATWDNTRKKWRRAESHHYDLLAALVYLVGQVDEFHNPFTPESPDLAGHWVNPDAFATDEQDLANAFAVELE